MRLWKFENLDRALVMQLAKDFDLPVFSAMLLSIRGITKQDDILSFFSQDAELSDPFEILDMDKAAQRIKQAIINGEKICVYGDYDCDGVTSTAIIYTYLESIGANVMFYIPNRESEGYGVNNEAIEKLRDENVKLILTVDNGISAIDEANFAADIGIDLVITDHHKPQTVLPRACAVVDPHRADCPSKFKHYSGAGLALKLVMALEDSSLSSVENYADLASLGTVADLVSVVGENRTIIKAGLKALENTERIGIRALCEKASIGKFSSGTVAFRLAPRINVAGRLASPYDALELFLTEDENTAEEKAEKLNRLNSERQSIEADIYGEAEQILENCRDYACSRIIVIDGKGWHNGVIGIVSSKITEKYGKPSIIISYDGDEARGSGRSIRGFSLVDAIFACSNLLTKFGGHPMAVGFSLKAENIADFRREINAYAAKNYPEMPLLELKIDCKLKPESINADIVKQIQYFEPFGYDNAEPVFALTNMRLDRIIPIGNGKHLRLYLSRDNVNVNILKFFETIGNFPYKVGDIIDIAVTLETNIYQGVESVSVFAKELRPSGLDSYVVMRDIQLYEAYITGEDIDKTHLKKNIPTRDNFAAVYRFLRSETERNMPIGVICMRLSENAIGAFMFLMILEIMQELHLIDFKRKSDEVCVKVHNIQGKVDLNTSSILKKMGEDARNG